MKSYIEFKPVENQIGQKIIFYVYYYNSEENRIEIDEEEFYLIKRELYQASNDDEHTRDILTFSKSENIWKSECSRVFNLFINREGREFGCFNGKRLYGFDKNEETFEYYKKKAIKQTEDDLNYYKRKLEEEIKNDNKFFIELETNMVKKFEKKLALLRVRKYQDVFCSTTNEKQVDSRKEEIYGKISKYY